MSFIFTCKEATHPWITETVANSYLEEASRREWNGRHHHGYNLEHDFGHGEDHASELFCLLNLLAFQFHTILGLAMGLPESAGGGGTSFSTISTPIWAMFCILTGMCSSCIREEEGRMGETFNCCNTVGGN
jgi:hypothetical protein